MKTNAGVAVLAILCVLLAVVLFVRGKKAQSQIRENTERITSLSNELAKASYDLDDQRQVNATLERAIEEQKSEIAKLEKQLTQTSTELSKANDELLAAKAEITKRNARIAELETQNQSLDQQAQELTAAINNLNAQIADTEWKLAAAEGDKAFLEAELKRLLAEKAELERRFTDLALLRAQVKKLKEELAVAKRLDWIRKGLFGDMERKGAEKLVTGIKETSTAAKHGPQYDLNVEIDSDGTVRVIKPLTGEPAATNPPPSQ